MTQTRDHFYRLILDLFYPAVLGTVFVALFPLISADLHEAHLRKSTLVLAFLIVHYTADYIYTKSLSGTYATTAFLGDLALLFLFYQAHLYLTGSAHADYHLVARNMAVSYLIFGANDICYFWRNWRKLAFRILLMVELLLAQLYAVVWIKRLGAESLMALLATSIMFLLVMSGYNYREARLNASAESGG